MVEPIRIVVADDQALFREALAQLLGSQGDMTVVGQAGDGQETLDQAKLCRPDIILMDTRMPKIDGLTATELIRHEAPDTKVVILTASDDERDVFEALKNGAVGYLMKSTGAEILCQKVRDIARGEIALTPILSSRVLDEFGRLRHWEERTSENLSEREKEVLKMVVSGHTNRKIAESLSIAESTTKRHLHNIFRKLHAKNRTEATAHAVRSGLFQERPSPRLGNASSGETGDGSADHNS